MLSNTRTIVFLVGLGASIEIYNDFIKLLKERIPHQSFHFLQWWDQDDFGKKELEGYLQNWDTILIGHSAGGSMAINALANSPDAIKKVVMIDSHTLKGINALPSIETFLDIILKPDGEAVIKQVRDSYTSVIKDSAQFDRALVFLSEWVKNDLQRVFATIETLPAHTVLHIGNTDSHYEVVDEDHQKELKEFWAQHNIDTEYLPMTHFDLIMPKHAGLMVAMIDEWLGVSGVERKCVV